MLTGIVANYKDDSGYGFIRPDDGGASVIVHVRHVMNADALQKDQRVSFDVVTDDRRNKRRADRVRVL
jgi:CspA family cold shock protein